MQIRFENIYSLISKEILTLGICCSKHTRLLTNSNYFFNNGWSEYSFIIIFKNNNVGVCIGNIIPELAKQTMLIHFIQRISYFIINAHHLLIAADNSCFACGMPACAFIKKSGVNMIAFEKFSQ